MSSTTTRSGRRKGKPDTRAAIVAAAKEVFGAVGYDAASLRAVARHADVDPALIYHYFEGKAELFMAALQLPVDPRHVAETLPENLPVGERIVVGFLRMWELDEPPPAICDDSDFAVSTGHGHKHAGHGHDGQGVDAACRHPFIATLQASLASPAAGAAFGEFLAERVWSRVPRREDDSDVIAALRHPLVASQLIGLAWVRHVLRREPLASAPIEVIAHAVGPTLERYIEAVLGVTDDQLLA